MNIIEEIFLKSVTKTSYFSFSSLCHCRIAHITLPFSLFVSIVPDLVFLFEKKMKNTVTVSIKAAGPGLAERHV